MYKTKSSQLDIQQGPIAWKLILFSLPIAASAFLQQILNATDIAVVGRFCNSNAIAAVGANTFIINLMLNLFMGLSVGANVVIARYIGQKRHDDVQKAVHTTLVLAAICGIFLSFLGWLVARPVLALLSTPEEIMDLSVLYFRIYFLGMPFMLIYNFASAILRSKGDTKRPLYIVTFSGIINVILNLFFVTQLHMSVEGVALATLISTLLSCLIILYLLYHEEEDLRLEFCRLSIDKHVLYRIAAIGIPAGIQGMIFSFSNVMIQGGVNSLGTVAVAANTVSLNFDYFCFFIGSAFGQAGTTFMSQNYGAKLIDRCRKVMRNCMILGPGGTFVLSIFLIAFATPFSALFTTDEEVIRQSVVHIQVVITFYCIHSSNEILSGMLRALGHSATPAVINVIFICGIRLLWVFFIFPLKPTYAFLLWCYPVSWVINISVLLPVFLHLTLKKFRKAEASLH